MGRHEAAPTRRRRRWPRRLLFGVLALVVLFYAGGGWYFSSVIDQRALDGAERRASLDPEYDVVVTSAADGQVTIARGSEWPDELTTPGLWGLRWDGGYGQLGDIVASGEGDQVTRELTVIDGSPPAAGSPAEVDPRAYPSIESTGLRSKDLSVPGPLGDYPAWFVNGKDLPLVIVVHGNSMSRLDNVRLLPALHRAGFPTLSITYRNDEGAPEDPSGKLRYGLTEWEDLEAAVRFAEGHTSRGVFLMGDSMGGGVIASFLQRSDLARLVDAVVLDAPMLDFSSTVDDNASREPLVGSVKLPSSLTYVAKQLAAWRFGVDWDQLNYLADTSRYDVPFLVFHGEQDTTVPISTSEAFAQARPDIVTLARCPGVDHIECWNLDPGAYERQMLRFLRDAVPPAA